MTSFEDKVNLLRQSSENGRKPLPRITLGAINSDASLHYAKAFGENSSDSTDTDAVHWVASCTKLVTTIAAMQCVERGLLDLDGDIASVLPEWASPQILTGFDANDNPIFRAATKPVTLRRMLTHSSGMGYFHMDPLMTRYHEQQGSPPLVQTFRQYQFLLFEPGERWMYSPGIDWAGVAVERATSMKLGDYLQRHVFDIVSVKDATFHLEQREDLRARKVKAWLRTDQGLEEEKNQIFPDPIGEDVGGGGLYTTVNEMLKICQGILTAQFLRPETIEEMFQPHLESASGLEQPEDYSLAPRNAIWNAIPHNIPVDFGIGGILNRSGIPQRREVNSLSWSGKPNCYWWIDIRRGIAGIYLSQLLPTGDQSAVELLTEFERWVYSRLDNLDCTAK
ncbi:serine hydrolase domain-containing protein [Aspergillus vadensis CBS 113365]|uniref:Beta-lactamase/transpeptidase-like protein n=1 Tax=Aspergillus vadensis (strain CBS 113365 / IMI 142717 / IBT 24658) TaxID=1448311 RepID=A0A319B6N5_ASPVC|nr:beta-lactamase/transpeptidase-like protein [Aspergillus vadensis CBS 113365]PYH67999.1 beta-lactamase/transpeptidase-like protein [Aspergillus vadensis CBS 113365]